MPDLERLQQWMSDNGHTMKSLARLMDTPYITVYMMFRSKKVSDRFITRFIRHFGCDEAVHVFVDSLTLRRAGQ